MEALTDYALVTTSELEASITSLCADLNAATYRQLSSYWDEHGCLIIKARLTAERGTVVIKAMDAAMQELKAAEPSINSASIAIDATTGSDLFHGVATTWITRWRCLHWRGNA